MLDISTIPLGHVRTKIGLIAQDPILLSGSLRLNLDSEGNYEDEQLFDALHQVRLIRHKQLPVTASLDSGFAVVKEDQGGPALQENVFTNLDSEIQGGGTK